jgi:hypothetical protein
MNIMLEKILLSFFVISIISLIKFIELQLKPIPINIAPNILDHKYLPNYIFD